MAFSRLAPTDADSDEEIVKWSSGLLTQIWNIHTGD
jgi:hypothetical protein